MVYKKIDKRICLELSKMVEKNRASMANELPGDPNAAGQGTTLWEPLV